MFFRKLLKSENLQHLITSLNDKNLGGSPRFIEGVLAGEMVKWDDKMDSSKNRTRQHRFDVVVVCPKNVERDGAVFGLTHQLGSEAIETKNYTLGPYHGAEFKLTGLNGKSRSILVISVNIQRNTEFALEIAKIWKHIDAELTVLLGIGGGDRIESQLCSVTLVVTANSADAGTRLANGKRLPKLLPESVPKEIVQMYDSTESHFEKPKNLSNLKELLRTASENSEYKVPTEKELETALKKLKIKPGSVEAGDSLDKSGEINQRLDYDITTNMVDMESRGFILAALGTDKCRDFAIIRGISDFADTQKGPKFQFIASVAAGATLGAMIETAYSTQQERAF